MSRSAAIGRLRHRVGATIAGEGLWGPGDRVAVAVSGGLDSVCLLDLLLATAGWHGGQLEVVTIDHGIHPLSAEHADQVERLAAEAGLAVTRDALALGPDASEAAARDARYAAFDRLPVDRIALAHHRDDLAETVLLHLLRGAGTRGLAGMAARRGRYVRPLLDVGRDELERWAAHRGLRWVEDPTNADPRFLRNRVRGEVLPLLDRLRPGAARAIARSARVAAEDDHALDGLAIVERALDPAWLTAVPRAVAGRALRKALPEAESAHVDAILALARGGGGAVELPGGRVVERDGERLGILADGRRRQTGPLD